MPVKQAFGPARLEENFRVKQALLEQQIKLAWDNVTYDGERAILCAISDNPGPGAPKCRESEKPRGPDGQPAPYTLATYLSQHQRLLEIYRQGQLEQAIALNFGPPGGAATAFQTKLDQLSALNQTYFDRAACDTLGVTKFGTLSCSEAGYLNVLQALTLLMLSLLPAATLLGTWFVHRLL